MTLSLPYDMPDLSQVAWSSLVIAVIGGDEREQEIARLAAATGANVRVFGFPMAESGIAGTVRASSAVEAISGAHYVLFPIPGMTADGAIFATEKIIPDPGLLSRAAKGAHVIMGQPHPDLITYGKNLAIGVHEYETDRELMLLRMPSIVEMALKHIIENTKVSIHRSRAVVVGQGNVAQSLTRILILLGAHVTVAARNPVQRAEAIGLGADAVGLERLSDVVGDADIIASAVPAPVVTPELIDRMNTDVFLADFAAPPGGVALDYARSRGINALWGRALGRRAPVTVGRSQWKGICERIVRLEAAKS